MTDVSPVNAAPRSKVRFGLRIKLLVAFAAALTLMFAVLSVFTITYVTDAAQAKIAERFTDYAAAGKQAPMPRTKAQRR